MIETLANYGRMEMTLSCSFWNTSSKLLVWKPDSGICYFGTGQFSNSFIIDAQSMAVGSYFEDRKKSNPELLNHPYRRRKPEICGTRKQGTTGRVTLRPAGGSVTRCFRKKSQAMSLRISAAELGTKLYLVMVLCLTHEIIFSLLRGTLSSYSM